MAYEKMTASMKWHTDKSTTRGEDYVNKSGSTKKGTKMKFPFKEGKFLHQYKSGDGYISYWNCKNDNGYKFSARIIHGKIIKTGTVKKGNTFFECDGIKYKPHMHIECHDIGHKNKDTIQNNRKSKTVIELKSMDKKGETSKKNIHQFISSNGKKYYFEYGNGNCKVVFDNSGKYGNTIHLRWPLKGNWDNYNFLIEAKKSVYVYKNKELKGSNAGQMKKGHIVQSKFYGKY